VPGLLQAFFYDPNPTFGASPTPFIVLMIMGFVVGIIGHIVRAKGLVALGIGMIFLATFLLPLLTNVLKSQQ
jgi:F0F1-type ATP synthase assembly protein I